MQWYYALNDQQQGPVSEDELRRLLAQGVITSQTLVWREGQADWKPFNAVLPQPSFAAQAPPPGPAAPTPGSNEATSQAKVICPSCGARTNSETLIPAGDKVVCPSCKGQYVQRLKQGAAATFDQDKPEGTGGTTPVLALIGSARQCLRGPWLELIGFVFFFWLTSVAINVILGLIPILGALATFAISGPLTLGLMTNMLRVSRGGSNDFSNIFIGFKDFGRAFGTYALTSIVVGLPIVILFIAMLLIPMSMGAVSDEPPVSVIAAIGVFGVLGILLLIYLGLRFSLIYFVLHDNPTMGVIDVIKLSWAMMGGAQVFRLLFLYILFGFFFLLGAGMVAGVAFALREDAGIMFGVLGVLVLGVALLIVSPWVAISFARFYDDI